MNNGVIATADHIPRNAGLFDSALRTCGSDGAEVVTRGGREALWRIRGVGGTGLPVLCRFVYFLRERGR